MRIAFFGVAVSFGYDQIGGTDSLYRRLAKELAGRGYEVEFVHYGNARDRSWSPFSGLNIFEYTRLGDALSHLEQSASVVLVNAIHAPDRLRFLGFRRRMRRQMAFHMVFTLYCEKRWKRFLHFLEAELYPYDPGVICVSSRLAREAARRRQRAWLLPPPVPQAYFRKSAEKPVSGAKVVTYIGRLGEGKGGEEIAAIMESLSHESDVALRVLAYAAGHDPIPLAIGERLRRLPRVRYERREHDGWSPVLEQELANELAGSDFLLLPYRRLSSSIDAPLLLLEGMASLCCVVTRPLGDIPRLYGNSPFLIEDEDVTMRTCELIRNATRVDIQAERARVAKQVAALECETSLVADRLLRILNGKEAPYDRP